MQLGDPSDGKERSPGFRRSGHVEFSPLDEDLVSNMVKPDSGWFLRMVEIKGGHRFSDVSSQCLPVVGLGDDAFGEALCYEAAVTFLRDFEDNLVHADQITALEPYPQGRSGQSPRSRQPGV